MKVRDKDKSHYPYSRLLKVDGMSCGNCASHVENALNSLEGVWAQVDLEKGEALVRMKQEYGNNELKQAVKDAGYVVYKIEESPEFSNRIKKEGKGQQVGGCPRGLLLFLINSPVQ